VPPTRRTLLTSGVGLLAGCLSPDSPDENTPWERTPATTESTSTRSPTSSRPPSVSFAGHAVQRSALSRRQPDFEAVWGPPDRQLLFAMLSVERGDPADLRSGAFSLRIGDRTVSGVRGVEGRDGETHHPRPDGCACDGSHGTYVAFPLPAPLSADAGEVRRESAGGSRTWSLPDDALSAAAAPTAEWELGSFEAPDRVGPNDSFPVAVEARNVGDAAGTFRGVLNEVGPMYGVSGRWTTRATAGATVRRELTIDTLAEVDSDASELRLGLRTVAGGLDHAVRVE